MRLIDADSYIERQDECGWLDPITVEGFNEITPTVEAISNADYENRLKADMIAILEDLKKEMNPIKECEYQIYGKEHWNFVGKCQDVICSKITKLKENMDV